MPDSLTVALPDYGETLAPTLAFKDPRPKDANQPWLLLVQTLPLATDLDARVAADERGWSASPTERMERLLRETKIPIGVLNNGTQIRLLYAPRGENSGNITFHVRHMTEVAGRPILAALHMLLSEACSGATPSEARLPALLRRSREYQSTVSTTLAQQVLDSLYELLRGFQAADERDAGNGGAGVLRIPRRPHGAEQRRPDQNLQPLSRPGRIFTRHHQAPRVAREEGRRRPRRLRLDRPAHHLRFHPRLR